jgi:hypothetical protein
MSIQNILKKYKNNNNKYVKPKSFKNLKKNVEEDKIP